MNYNEESLWWINIFERKKKNEILSLKVNSDNDKNILSSVPHARNTNSNMTNKYFKCSFICLCKICHIEPTTRNSITPNYSIYKIIPRMIVSSFSHFKALHCSPKINEFEDEFIHFLINKLLTSYRDYFELLEIPVSFNYE
ncbi:OB-fold nucleic acid binding domain protein [Cryptosporidium felis]|nr:OB-fold nucleic acid binding domain protein [Cryptosporidium felis]